MNEQVFWKIIETSGDDENAVNARFHNIERALGTSDLKAIFKFDKVLYWLLDKANFEDLWAACCVLTDEYTEANFLHFRFWLIFQGQRIFKKTINDPEYLEIFSSDFQEERVDLSLYADFEYLAERVYHHKTQLKDYKTATPYALKRANIKGKALTDSDMLSDLVPLLCKKMGWDTEFFGGKWISDE